MKAEGEGIKVSPNTVLTRLTEKGRNVAKRVGEIEEIPEMGG